jgi:hypothetical protein
LTAGRRRILRSVQIEPRCGTISRLCRASGDRTLVSSTSLSTAAAAPASSPSSPASRRFCIGRGESGVAFCSGPVTTSTFTADVSSPGADSNACTRVTNAVASDRAIRNDRAADVSVTVACSRTLSGTARALIRDRTCAASRPSVGSAAIDRANRSLVSTSTYDFTRWAEKRLPAYASLTPRLGTFTKKVMLDA